MKIVGLAGYFPPRKVSNQEVIDLVKYHSDGIFVGDLAKTLRTIDKLFEKSGFESRQWLSDGEDPMALVEVAFERALAQSGLARKDIDLLIYSSVTRGFTEPANSAFVAKRFGLNCMNYDLVNACMGWVSSLDLVNDKMKAGTVRHAVVVNMELSSLDGGVCFPKNATLNTAAELEYKFPTLTVGDGLAVTILSSEAPENFKFSFVHRPQASHFCTISLPKWEYFCSDSDKESIRPSGGKYQFSSNGAALHDGLMGYMNDVLDQQKIPASDINFAFTHTSSPRKWAEMCNEAGFGSKLHGIGHRTGNIVTTSGPLTMLDGIGAGRLKKNDFCLGWIGSAGMSYCAMTFKY
jgi:3-oxoacyl-[acyl-carrier-protein] synthase III